MKRLTKKEEIIMGHFWTQGAMFVRDLQALYPEPKPHFNTLSTQVRTLEQNGYLSHMAYGNSYCYAPAIGKSQYYEGTIGNVVKTFFNNSYRSVVSSFVKDKKLTVEDLKDIIRMIETGEE